MLIQRYLLHLLLRGIKPNKVIVLLGARRTGKTFLINQLIEKLGSVNCLLLNGEDLTVQQQLIHRNIAGYKALTQGYKFVFIDEAQTVPDIGTILKLMVDEIKGLHLIVTGSSMFDLENRLGEPLTGRKKDFTLFPLSQLEYSTVENVVERNRNVEERLIFGCYPELLQLKTSKLKRDYLRELVSSYLFKDILILENIRNANKLADLLKLIAWQVGREVSLEELG